MEVWKTGSTKTLNRQLSTVNRQQKKSPWKNQREG